MTIQIGSFVKTEHGIGKVVGIDLPEEEYAKRWIVQITKPRLDFKEKVERFKDCKLCYFDREIIKEVEENDVW